MSILSTRRRRTLAAIEAIVGLNAIGGMAYALGGAKHVPEEWLDGTPFDSSVIAAQVAMIGYRSPLQPTIAGAGVAVAALGGRP
jgi:hypothetical protein